MRSDSLPCAFSTGLATPNVRELDHQRSGNPSPVRVSDSPGISCAGQSIL
jgi:hypothetical protein